MGCVSPSQKKNLFSKAVKMPIYICHKCLTTLCQLEVSRLNRANILKQYLFPCTGKTTLCCRTPQSAWPASSAANTATSPKKVSGHHVLLTPVANHCFPWWATLGPSQFLPWRCCAVCESNRDFQGSHDSGTSMQSALACIAWNASVLDYIQAFALVSINLCYIWIF